MSESRTGNQWVVYMLECQDGTYYTGITNHLERRITEHNDSSPKSKAARYTRSRQPVKIIYSENCENRQDASKKEFAIKKLSRRQKEKLVHKHVSP